MKKIIFFLLVLTACSSLAAAQELPQFKSSTLEGWVYNNPNVELNSSNVSNGRIVLYVTTQGEVYTLISPEFSCQGIDSIAASIIWYTPTFNQSGFDINKTALTMAIDDADGQPVDSVTCTPTVMASSQTLTMTLAVPAGLNQAKLRFVSWKANVLSSGAIKRALFTAITSSQHEVIPGDVDGDGKVGMDDLAVMINYMLTFQAEGIDMQNADVDCSGNVGMDDLAELIIILLTASR